MNLETLAIHAGHNVDPATGAVAPPLYLSTTFERGEDGSYPYGYSYSRSNNPNRVALETRMTALEGGAAALAFASGSAATFTLLQALQPGDHVVAPSDAYYGTAVILRQILGPWGLEASYVDMADLDEVEHAIRPTTKIVWTETPSNPLLRITDIAAVAERAHVQGATVVCDNTWASPILQRPLELGADIVMHSTTKYLGGHADVTGGMLVAKTDDDFFQRVRLVQRNAGAVPSPFDCWLIQRGITTLVYRMRGHCENAGRVARFLNEQPSIESVHYPGLTSHPGHAIATRQMSDFGGMVSIQVKGGRAEALALAGRVKLFTRATSLGGVESLIEHRASVEGPTTKTPENLLRLSIGLEHPDDLIADLEQALR